MTKFQIKCSCVKCKQETTTGQLIRNHKEKCPEKIAVRFPKNIGRTAWNKGLNENTDERVKANSDAIRSCGKMMGRCSDPEKEIIRRKKLSDKAKQLGFGGYRENAGRSKKFKVYDSFGNQTTLQSTYEYSVFEILCELGVNWVRPKALKYNGKNYFADFYLPDYDVWLDPKNSYKAEQDEEKINFVRNQNAVKLYVLLHSQITKEHISRLIYG